MFGLGMTEIIIILVFALLVLGPKKLPDAAKQLGKGLRDFRRATEDLKSQFEGELYSNETTPPKSAKPTLVDGSKAGGEGAPGPASPSPAPVATADNVPGLDAAIVESPAPAEAPPKAS
jgi:sec-independent protein translocase protein TatB